jgi:hypothetical protein
LEYCNVKFERKKTYAAWKKTDFFFLYIEKRRTGFPVRIRPEIGVLSEEHRCSLADKRTLHHPPQRSSTEINH